jgi:hypothetical protein
VAVAVTLLLKTELLQFFAGVSGSFVYLSCRFAPVRNYKGGLAEHFQGLLIILPDGLFPYCSHCWLRNFNTLLIGSERTES